MPHAHGQAFISVSSSCAVCSAETAVVGIQLLYYTHRVAQDLPTAAMAAASGRALAAWALFVLLVVGAAVDASQEEVLPPGSPAPAPSPASSISIDCGSACAARCAVSSRQKLCRRACGSCCARCDCVPPGTAGNHDACPCYAAITTRGGRHKCP